MKAWSIAIIAGLLIEAVLFSILEANDFGPCGFSSPLLSFVFLAHLPALFVASPFFEEAPMIAHQIIVFALASVIWIFLVRGIIATLPTRR